jgi:hypothetical protein
MNVVMERMRGVRMYSKCGNIHRSREYERYIASFGGGGGGMRRGQG